MFRTLRREGDSLVITLPRIFIQQNHLHDGSRVRLTVSDAKMIVSVPQRPRYVLAELLAEMPATFPMVEGWDKLRAAGGEVDD
jgi:antitoxin ChpS